MMTPATLSHKDSGSPLLSRGRSSASPSPPPDSAPGASPTEGDASPRKISVHHLRKARDAAGASYAPLPASAATAAVGAQEGARVGPAPFCNLSSAALAPSPCGGGTAPFVTHPWQYAPLPRIGAGAAEGGVVPAAARAA